MPLSHLNDKQRLGERGDTHERRPERDEYSWVHSPVPPNSGLQWTPGAPGPGHIHDGGATQRDEGEERLRLRRRFSFSHPPDKIREYNAKNLSNTSSKGTYSDVGPRPTMSTQKNQNTLGSGAIIPGQPSPSQDLNASLAASLPPRPRRPNQPMSHHEAVQHQVDKPTSAGIPKAHDVPPPIPLTAENLYSVLNTRNPSIRDSDSSRGSRDTQDSWRVRPSSPSTSVGDDDVVSIVVKGNARVTIGTSSMNIKDGAEIRIRSGDVKDYRSVGPSPEKFNEERQPRLGSSAPQRRSSTHLSRDVVVESDRRVEDNFHNPPSHRRGIDSQTTHNKPRSHSTSDSSNEWVNRAQGGLDDFNVAKGSRRPYMEDCDEDGNVIDDTRTYMLRPQRKQPDRDGDALAIPNTSRIRKTESARILTKKTVENSSPVAARTSWGPTQEVKDAIQTRSRPTAPVQVFQPPSYAPQAQNSPSFSAVSYGPISTPATASRPEASPVDRRPSTYYGQYLSSVAPPQASGVAHYAQHYYHLPPVYQLPSGYHSQLQQMRLYQPALASGYMSHPIRPSTYPTNHSSSNHSAEHSRTSVRPPPSYYQTGSRDDSAVPRHLTPTDTLHGSEPRKTLRRRPVTDTDATSYEEKETRVAMPPPKPRKANPVSATLLNETATDQDMKKGKAGKGPITTMTVGNNPGTELDTAPEEEEESRKDKPKEDAEELFRNHPLPVYDVVKAEEKASATMELEARATVSPPTKITDWLNEEKSEVSRDVLPLVRPSQIIHSDIHNIFHPTDNPYSVQGGRSSASTAASGVPEDRDGARTSGIGGTASGKEEQHTSTDNLRGEYPQNTVKTASNSNDFVKDEADTMSLPSYAESTVESVFDAMSSGSTASSVPGDVQALVGAFVDLLARDKSIDRMLKKILAEPEASIGTERFSRNFSRILRSYARGLKQNLTYSATELIDASQAHAVAFISRKTMHASNLVVSRYSGPMKQPGVMQSDNASLVLRHLDQVADFDSDEDTDFEDAQQTFAINSLELFLTTGEPFRRLKWNLRALILPDSFLERVEATVARLIGLVDKTFASLLLDLEAQCRVQKASFSTILAGRIRDFGLSLTKECSTRSQYEAADFLALYAEYIAVRLVQSIDDPRAHGSDSHVLNESPSSEVYTCGDSPYEAILHGDTLSETQDILEDIVASTLPTICEANFSGMWQFVKSSKSFVEFLQNLHEEAFPTFFTKARDHIMETISSAGMDDEEIQAEGRRLLPILTEIQWCVETKPKGAELRFNVDQSSEAYLTVSDRIKLAVEASTGSQWNWWPLRPPPSNPQTPKNDNDVFISWTCNCGALRQEKVAAHYSASLQMLYEQYPLTTRSTSSGTPPPQRPTSSLSNNSSEASSPDSMSDSSSVGEHDAGRLSAASTIVTMPSANASVVSLTDDQRSFVFLLVLRAARFRFVSTEVTKMSSHAFFRTLVDKYKEKRGSLRQLFSIFVYSHCDFVKVRRFAPQRFGPGAKFSYPPCDDTEYKFTPRPMEEAPITRHMFYELFHACYDEDTLLHRLHNSVSLSGCDVLRTLPDELIHYLPKRNCDVSADAQFDKVEIFWGLVAREQRSALRVAVYTLLSLLPSVWFGFQWMFGWGHPDDLQDATVPFMMTCTIWGMLWAAVYSGSDVKEI